MKNYYKDFEDNIQYEVAVESNMDYLITRNTKDFPKDKIKIITPSEFIKLEL